MIRTIPVSCSCCGHNQLQSARRGGRRRESMKSIGAELVIAAGLDVLLLLLLLVMPPISYETVNHENKP